MSRKSWMEAAQSESKAENFSKDYPFDQDFSTVYRIGLSEASLCGTKLTKAKPRKRPTKS